MSPQRAPRPCLVCHRPTRAGSWCPEHQPHWADHPTNPAYRDPGYRRTRAKLLTAWRREHGDWCPGATDLNHPPHPEPDLTVDHIIPLRDGGTHDESNLRILCRKQNSRWR